MAKAKQNALAYDSVPAHNVVLFDCFYDGAWRYDLLKKYASLFGMSLAPVLHEGVVTVEALRELLATESYLGGQKIEGVVIKNMGQSIIVNGKPQPVITKLVRAEFKETNKVEHKSDSVFVRATELIESYRSEARWQKALQHLRDDGAIEDQPRDIAALIREVQCDILDEETENIKAALFAIYKKDLLRNATRGLPEWYKSALVGRVA
jgi:hypothetical protein